MTRVSPPLKPAADLVDEAAITKSAQPRKLWTTILIWIMRLASCLCLLRGLTYWTELLGLFDMDFIERPLLQQSAIIFFAVIYCFAAVGLWLAAAWGAVVWFLAIAGEVALVMFEPGMRTADSVETVAISPLSSILHMLIGLAIGAIYLCVYRFAPKGKKV